MWIGHIGLLRRLFRLLDGANYMWKVFSTIDVHPRDRFEFWHDVASINLAGHSSQTFSKLTFNAQIEMETLADIGIVQVEKSPMTVSRTKRHVAQSKSDEIFVCQQIAGSFLLEQNERQMTLRQGDLALIDPGLPYDAVFSSNSKLLILKVPRGAFNSRVGAPRDLVARCLPSSPEYELLSSLVSTLPRVAGNVSTNTAEILRSQTLDLLALSVAKMGEKNPRLSSAHSLAILYLRGAIEARLTDPALDAPTIAAAAGVSVRHANALLARENTSLGRLVLSMRLDRCKRAMEDPSQNHRTISEIAYGWGFSDMTHFGRSFKAKYGLPPREYRQEKASVVL